MLALSEPGAHILVFPYPAQGHMLPLLDLTHQLALRNITITILVTPKNLHYLNPLLSKHPASIYPLVFPFPANSALPFGVENIHDLPSSTFRLKTIMALADFYDPIVNWFQDHPSPPVAIVSDTEFSFRLVYDPAIQTESSNVVKVFGGLHKIEKISIAEFFIVYLAAGGSPNRFSNPLSCLKTLCISNMNSTCLSEVSCLLCLIRSAPNLFKLHISVRHMHFKSLCAAIYRSCLTIQDYVIFYQAKLYSEEEDLEDYCEEDNEDCTLNYLEIITFSHFKGLKAEFELVKFLLAHSPLLKTMFIHHKRKMKKDVAVEILEEMLEFPRASSRAQIRSLKLPFKADDFGPWVNR